MKSNNNASQYASRIMNQITDNLMTISGNKYLCPSEKDKLEMYGVNAIVSSILIDISMLNLDQLSIQDRIYLFDLAVKLANIKVIKALSQLYIDQGFQSDITVPSKDNQEYPYRPVFWLASIVTRQPAITSETYSAVEKYICETFKIPEVVNINGKNITRQEYIAGIEKWKHENNIRLFSPYFDYHFKWPKPRYPRHVLMNEIEKYDQSKLRSTPSIRS